MKRVPIGFLLSWAGLLLLTTGCVSKNGPPLTDRIVIKSIEGSRPNANGFIFVRVTVEYALASSAEGDLALGFDIREAGRYQMMTQQRVARGSGTAELLAEFNPQGRRLLTTTVNLSEWPRPQRWQPLAHTLKQFSPRSDSAPENGRQ